MLCNITSEPTNIVISTSNSPRTTLLPPRYIGQDISSSSYEGAARGVGYMNPAAPIQYTQTEPHHGIKRGAPLDDVEHSSNISTHFKKLRLNNANIPQHGIISPVGVSLRASPLSSAVDAHPVQTHEQNDTASHNVYGIPAQPLTPIIPPRTDDFMPLDDTPHRIYISDLDAEIAAIEAADGTSTHHQIFLPDIDKTISKIPDHILRGDGLPPANLSATSSQRANEQALILYREPSSITVPEEEDAVRKAIIATRKQAREKMKRDYELQQDRVVKLHDSFVSSDIDDYDHSHNKDQENSRSLHRFSPLSAPGHNYTDDDAMDMT